MNSIVARLKRLVPGTVKEFVKTSPLLVRHRSGLANAYHCTVYRTGSQWMRRVLSDRRVCRYSGLLYEMHFQRVMGTCECPDETVTHDEFPYTKPFRQRRIVGLYASYESYLRIPKPTSHKAFFIFRDPRDIVVSHYFASRRDAQRQNLPTYEALADPKDGIPFMMDLLAGMGLFAALDSWAALPSDPHVRLLRYEELIGPRQSELFRELFAHCDIAMPDDVLQRLLEDHGFQALSGGRQPGQEDTSSHYRKGVAGDWRIHFSAAHVERFRALTGDLVTRCGYEW